MGIVNVTPDSFSDGGQIPRRRRRGGPRASARRRRGRSRRTSAAKARGPDATPVPDDVELAGSACDPAAGRRDGRADFDRHAQGPRRRAAVDAGAEIINDVTRPRGRSARWSTSPWPPAPASCVMHMQGTPETMQHQPNLQRRRRRGSRLLCRAAATRCWPPALPRTDLPRPGHRLRQDLRAQSGAARALPPLHALGCPLLVGHSRKSFLGKLLGDDGADRDCRRPSASRWAWPPKACRCSAFTTCGRSARRCWRSK